MTSDGALRSSSSKNNPAAQSTSMAAAAVSAAPLGQRPTLRMQDGDIILEDGALKTLEPSPFASTTPNNHTSLEHHYHTTADLGKSPATPLPADPTHTSPLTPMMMLHSSQFTINSLQAQPSRPPTFNNGGSGAPTPTPEPARSATTGGGVGSFRLHFDVVESVHGAKYRTTELTASNVQQLTKQQYGNESSKAGTTERMWRWLKDAGPPYDVHPSVGVSSKLPLNQANRKSGIKLSTCFKCFS
ncbi:hypothetical protein Ndes2526B_g03532 [Nannochloris sp. 'desiccata']|nr:hypothetical protein NADE_005277 [Chlorella desiccata (nom. nud.)]